MTLAAFDGEQTIATITVGVDSPTSLALEELHPDEVRVLRGGSPSERVYQACRGQHGPRESRARCEIPNRDRSLGRTRRACRPGTVALRALFSAKEVQGIEGRLRSMD